MILPLVSVHAAPGTITDSAVIVRVRARATSTFTKFFSAMRADLDDSALQDCYIVMASEHIIYTESQSGCRSIHAEATVHVGRDVFDNFLDSDSLK